MTSDSNLLIYNASAGSGKTYNLAKEIVMLLIENPYHYKNILAVTFTNKAAGEMKVRVLTFLSDLAKNDASELLSDCCSRLELNAHMVNNRAQKALQLILNNYSQFNIQTIDSFFQQVIRSFARELGLFFGFNIEMDVTSIVSMAVDKLYINLDKDPALLAWLKNYTNYRMDENKGWNLRNDLKSEGEKIFKEVFKELSASVHEFYGDYKLLENYSDGIINQVKSFDKFMLQKGIEAMRIIEKHQLSIDSFKGASKSFANFFIKIQKGNYELNATTKAAVDSIENWCKKGSEKEVGIIKCYNELNPLLAEIIAYHRTNYPRYIADEAILKSLHFAGILHRIEQEVNAICREQNLFLISESSHLLKGLIDNNDIPFVYEKTGNVFHTIMIDEFQDTSVFQWSNFKPLIENSLSQGNKVILLGDTKQSIYRWRNSDWKIMASDVDKALSQFGILHVDLTTNYRSEPIVVNFNNSLFSSISNVLLNEWSEFSESVSSYGPYLRMADAYHKAIQKTKQAAILESGFVEVARFKQQEGLRSVNEVYDNNAKEYVFNVLGRLFKNEGFKPSDIAFLVRSKKEAANIIAWLMEYKNSHAYTWNVISEDSLKLNSSNLVLFINACLEYLIDRESQLKRANCIIYYSMYIQKSNWNGSNNEFLPLDNVTGFLDQLVEKPRHLLHMVYTLIQYFELTKYKSEHAFLDSYLDVVTKFSQQNYSDIASFIEWWKDKSDSLVIPPVDDENSIKVMTIHKSKGLQFNTVILPYCRWNLMNKTPELWVNNYQENPEKVFVKFNSEFANSVLALEYHHEMIRDSIDSINILYVALTRAEKNLFIAILPPYSKVSNVSDVINTLLPNLSANLPHKIIDLLNVELYNFGELSANIDAKSMNRNELIDIGYTSSIDRFKLLTNNISNMTKSIESGNFIRKGKQLHSLFGRFTSTESIDLILNESIVTREYTTDEVIMLKQKIDSAFFKYSELNTLFNKESEVYNEQEILLPSGELYRPDRLSFKNNTCNIVDFKFGLKKSEKYLNQVLTYKSIVEQMGKTVESACIWYVMLEEVEFV